MRFNILLFLQLDFSSKAAAGSGWELFFGEVSSYIAENCKNPAAPVLPRAVTLPTRALSWAWRAGAQGITELCPFGALPMRSAKKHG